MKLLTKVICAAAIAMPLLASAAEVKITNSTMRQLKFHIGSLSCERDLPSYFVQTISENVFKQACSSDPKKCVLTIVDADPKIRTPIVDITFNSHDGVIDIHNYPTNTIKVLANRYDVVLK